MKDKLEELYYLILRLNKHRVRHDWSDLAAAAAVATNKWDQTIGFGAPEKGLEHLNLWKMLGQDKTWSPGRKLEKRRFFLILQGKKSNS